MAQYKANRPPDDTPEIDAISKPKRHFWRRFGWVIWLAAMVPVVYVAVQLVIIMAPQVRTEAALQDTMTDSVSAQGHVVLSSVPVYGGTGTLYYTVPTGQRVMPGAEVAKVFGSEAAVQAMDRAQRLDAEIELLREAQATTAVGSDLENLLGQQHSALYSIIQMLDTGNYDAIETPRNEMLLAANKWQVATGEAENYEARITALTAESERYKAQATATGTITAEEGGYFAPSPQHDRQQVSYDTVSGLTPTQLQTSIAQPAATYGATVAGHIITDYKWHFFTVLPAKDAEKFVVGHKSLQISFPDISDMTLPVMVKSVVVDEENGIAAIELYCEYMRPELMQLRVENAQIIFGVEKGLRINKNALRLVDFANDDGSKTTYQGVYVKFGNMVYFRKVQILLEEDGYMLVSPVVEEGVNEVEMYDDVVVDAGGVELYDRKIL
ncbi:MAG: hypothetical protein GXY32_03270 [Ruminococcaceae bacterium]|nr:hypothetical protein [Oscillospiraceae bacterium]